MLFLLASRNSSALLLAPLVTIVLSYRLISLAPLVSPVSPERKVPSVTILQFLIVTPRVLDTKDCRAGFRDNAVTVAVQGDVAGFQAGQTQRVFSKTGQTVIEAGVGVYPGVTAGRFSNGQGKAVPAGTGRRIPPRRRCMRFSENPNL